MTPASPPRRPEPQTNAFFAHNTPKASLANCRVSRELSGAHCCSSENRDSSGATDW
jgi:hypothetical protein